MGNIMKVNRLVIGLLITVFLCGFHYFLANAYHYFTSVSEPEVLWSMKTWSYPYKRDVFGFNFAVAFFGVAASIILSMIKEN
jgi:hypothetical protein